MKRNRLERFVLRYGASLALVAVAMVMACDSEVDLREPPPERVEAVFDPETGVIPLPNDAAMDEGYLPGLPGAEAGTPAGELSTYMQGLTGWPRTTPIEIPFSGPLDEESITENAIRLYQVIDDDELVPHPIAELVYTESESTSKVGIVPALPPRPGDRFAAIATKDLMGANGHSVGASLPIFLAGSRVPLVDDGQPTLEILDGDLETAQTLEGLRLLLKPVYDQVESGIADETAVDRDDVVSAFRWTIMPEAAVAFFPDAGEVPLPNTAALDPDGTFPDQASCFLNDEEESNNQRLDEYLSGLSGWPDTVPISITLTAAIEEPIEDDDVQVWKETEAGWERVQNLEISYRDFDVDNCDDEAEPTPGHFIDINPGGPLDINTNYFAFATRNISAVGEQQNLIAEGPMFLAMQPYDLIDENGSSQLSTLSDEDAQAIQGIRQSIAPAMAHIQDEFGFDHHDLAGVWSWYTWNDTFAVFNPETGRIPFPHVALMGEDGTVEIPIADDANMLQQGLLQALNQRDGFSRSAPGWLPVDGAVDQDSITPQSFRIFPQNTFVELEEDELKVQYESTLDRVVYEPLVPYASGQRYFGLVTSDVMGTNGRPIQPSLIFVLLRMPDPLIENGESKIWALGDETPEEVALLEGLEDARRGFQDMFGLFGIMGFDREEVAMGWVFDTEDPVQPLREYRAQTMNRLSERAEVRAFRACEVEGGCNPPTGDPNLVEIGDEMESPNEAGVMIDMSNVRAAHFAGEFEATTVDVPTSSVSGSGEPIGISVYLPEDDQQGGQCSAPYDTVIVQHGLNGDRWSGLAVANEMAAAPGCLATVAMDLPLHGGRTTTATTPHPPQTPTLTDDDESFLTANFIASKGNFVQGIVDLFVLAKIIEGDGVVSGLDALFEDLDGDDGPFIDSSAEVGFLGISLGTVVGVPFAAIDPSVETMALHGGGGRMSWILQGDEEGLSTVGEPLIGALEQLAGITPEDPDFFEAMVFVQWLADRIDPFIFADVAAEGDMPTLSYDPGEDTYQPTTAGLCDEDIDCGGGLRWQCVSDVCVEHTRPSDSLVQMSTGDRTIVNRSTVALAAQLGASLSETTFDDVPHAFIREVNEGSESFSAAECARLQVAQWITSGLMGAAELPSNMSAEQCLQN